MNTYSDVFNDKQRIIFFGAHPDDIDVFFGGTIAKLISEGKTVRCVVATSGARGSKENKISLEELIAIREKEETEALSHLGVKPEHISFLGLMDGEIQQNNESMEKIVRELRSFQPDIACVHNPQEIFFESTRAEGKLYVNHRDHRRLGELVIDAVYPQSRDASFFPEHTDEGLKTCKITHIYLTGENNHNTDIDVTDIVERKRQALLSHKSQFTEEAAESVLGLYKDGDNYSERGVYIQLSS